MKFVLAALVVIFLFWLYNSPLIDRNAPELSGPIGAENAYSLRPRGSAAVTPGTSTTNNTIPETGGLIYTLQPGDTLSGVATRYNRSLGQLLYVNPSIQNPNLVAAGQQIIIPPANSPSATVNNLSSTNTNPVSAQQPVVPVSGRSGTSSPTPAANSPTPTTLPAHWILVDLATQRLTAYEVNQPVKTFSVSTGVSEYPTLPGTYHIYVKYPTANMTAPGYDLKNVPYVMYYDPSGYGYAIHGAYWHNNFGTPMSHGCINLSVSDAAWLYQWAPVGTEVVIQ